MNDETKQDKGQLVISSNRSLLLKKNDLVKRGLELIPDLKRRPLTISNKAKKKILFIDDDKTTVEAFVESLHLHVNENDVDGIIFNGADCESKVMKNISNTNYDILLINFMMPGINGIDLTRKIKEKRVDLPIILHTGNNRFTLAVESMRAGADDLIIKPFGWEDINLSIEKVLKQNMLQKKGTDKNQKGFTKDKLKFESYYRDHKFDGLSRDYYESGKVLVEWNYKNGTLEGISKVYREDGTLLAEANFKNGVQDGMNKWYGSNGKARIVDFFKNGDTISRKIYDSSGNLRQDI